MQQNILRVIFKTTSTTLHHLLVTSKITIQHP